MKVITQEGKAKAMSVRRPDRASESKISKTNNEARSTHTALVGFENYPVPTKEFNALWKSYEDLSRAATASSLLKPIAVSCFTASTSSFSVEFS